MVKNIITGSENKIRDIIQSYGYDLIGSYADASLFVVFDDDNLIAGAEAKIIEKEVIKEVIKEIKVEVEKIVEVDNPKLLDKITSLGESLKTCQASNKDLAAANKKLEALNAKLKKTVESLTE